MIGQATKRLTVIIFCSVLTLTGCVENRGSYYKSYENPISKRDGASIDNIWRFSATEPVVVSEGVSGDCNIELYQEKTDVSLSANFISMGSYSTSCPTVAWLNEHLKKSGFDFLLINEFNTVTVPRTAFGQTPVYSASKPPRSSDKRRPEPESVQLIAVGSGSSFAVNTEGTFVSNQHVIDGCSKIELMKSGKPLEASVVASDERNDLALIQLSDLVDQEVFFRLSDEPIKVMDGVFVGGFPFGNLLGKNVKVTSGIVSSMAGINDDVSQLMIDAAIQPGNSGGPIFLTNGKLAAVTVASLDSLTILKTADALPQNTNFGIKLSVLREFLSANNVTIPEQSFFTRDFERDDLVNEAILQVICYARKGDVQKLKQRKVLFDALMKE